MTAKLDHYRLLGRSGLRVSPLSLGTMTFGVPAAWSPPAWSLLNRGVSSAIIGVRNMVQLEDKLAALELTLDEEHTARLDSVIRIEPGFTHELINSPMADNMFGGVRLDRPWRPWPGDLKRQWLGDRW